MQQLAIQYQAMSDDELLHLALELEQLAPEAQIQLETELAKRKLDTPACLEEFRAVQSQEAHEPSENSRYGSGFVATLRDWQRYRRQTGEWPVASVIASVAQGMVLFSCVLFMVVFAGRHHWSKARFLLVLGALLVPELCLWDRIQKKIRLKELEAYRTRRKA